MPPAQQRLETMCGAGLRPDNGLLEQRQLVALHGELQILLQSLTSPCRRAHLAVDKRHVFFAVLLGAVER